MILQVPKVMLQKVDTEDRKVNLEEEEGNPPSVDNPREFSKLIAREKEYIGDMESLW